MPSEAKPLFPRPAANPDSLQGLREQALTRVQQDETALVTSRRSALKQVAFLAAAATALTAAPTALAATVPSATTVGPRGCAPQYGVPYYNGPVPQTQMVKVPHNGDWWRDQTTSYREAFLAGVIDASIPNSNKMLPGTTNIYGVSAFYDDPKNRDIPVASAIRYLDDGYNNNNSKAQERTLNRLRQITADGTGN